MRNITRRKKSLVLGSFLVALSGCTDYLFPPQPPENVETNQLSASSDQNNLSEIAKDPVSALEKVGGTADIEDPDEAYRQRQLEDLMPFSQLPKWFSIHRLASILLV
jgi:hypothetical protein